MIDLHSVWRLWIPFLLVVYGQKEFDIRLAGGSTPREGRLEVFSDEQWGTVCDNQWDVADADVVCKQLGLSYATSAPKNAAFGQGEGHVHLWTLDCQGSEDNIGDCVRGSNDATCPHSQDASVICSDRGNPNDYDVRLIGGSQPSTGQVEVFFYGEWNILCSTPWSLIEGDTVCRQSGYGGALYTEGIIPEPVNRPLPILKGPLNCTRKNDPTRGYGHLYGCIKKDLVSVERGMCERPNTVACARHQEELRIRLFGGENNNASGRVEVYTRAVWWSICPDEWNLNDATVVCRQLGYDDDSEDIRSSATVMYPKGHEERYFLMSKVNCTGEEANIGLCPRVYGTRKCSTKEYATVTCSSNAARKAGRKLNKVVIVTALCLLLIPALLLVVFLVVFCAYKKQRKDSKRQEQKDAYSPVNQKEPVEMGKVTEEQKEPVKV